MFKSCFAMSDLLPNKKAVKHPILVWINFVLDISFFCVGPFGSHWIPCSVFVVLEESNIEIPFCHII